VKWRSTLAEILLVCAAALTLGGPATAGTSCDRARFTDGIDAGHSKRQPGAVSARGVPEYAFNARMAGSLRERLSARGYQKVLIINGDGTIGSLEARADAANAAPVDLLVSIHHDSVQPKYLSRWKQGGRNLDYSDRFRGFSIFVSRKNGAVERSIAFAKLLGDSLLAAGLDPTLHHAEPIPGEGRELLVRSRGIYFFDDLIVLKRARVPAVLLECGVIKHREEELSMDDDKSRLRMADAIVNAIDGFCALPR
jgi:N-acetylmuramoyl-L-alanine amidase